MDVDITHTQAVNSTVRFANRADAARQLAARLEAFPHDDVVVLGLPRGGVPIAYEVARALHAPLDIILVRKLGVPYQPELAMGAIGEDGVRVLNEPVLRATGVRTAQVEAVESTERAELERRARRYRGPRARVPLEGRTALIIDDGIATGSTVRAACHVARAHGAHRVVVAAPVAPPTTIAMLREDADDVVVLATPEHFAAIGQFYNDFSPTSDDEVVQLLAAAAGPAPGRTRDDEIELDVGGVNVGGHLTVPAAARGIVVFAHGSGSSRHSPRNRFVASVLQEAGLGTLLFDLLTTSEERDRRNVFDVELLATRLRAATAGLRTQPEASAAVIGYFGASTGAAAALWAAAEPDADIGAVVSRGGRPDLAGPRLAEVRAPTLLIVGGDDTTVLDLNRRARATMRAPTELAVVPGATHLFEEPGTLERAAGLARDWFVAHLLPS